MPGCHKKLGLHVPTTSNIPVDELDVSEEEGVENETSLRKNQGF